MTPPLFVPFEIKLRARHLALNQIGLLCMSRVSRESFNLFVVHKGRAEVFIVRKSRSEIKYRPLHFITLRVATFLWLVT